MNIDKRNSSRKQLDLRVDIYSFDEFLGPHRTRDIGLDGAFINNCVATLRPDDMIELRIHVHDGAQSRLRLRATVTRTTDKGAAVMFDYGLQEYRKLLDILSTYAADGHMRSIPGFWYEDRSVDAR